MTEPIQQTGARAAGAAGGRLLRPPQHPDAAAAAARLGPALRGTRSCWRCRDGRPAPRYARAVRSTSPPSSAATRRWSSRSDRAPVSRWCRWPRPGRRSTCSPSRSTSRRSRRSCRRLAAEEIGNVRLVQADAVDGLTPPARPGFAWPSSGPSSPTPGPRPGTTSAGCVIGRVRRPGRHPGCVPGGLWRLATDWADYAAAMRCSARCTIPIWRTWDAADGWAGRDADRPLTRFERRGIDAGRPVRRPHYHAPTEPDVPASPTLPARHASRRSAGGGGSTSRYDGTDFSGWARQRGGGRSRVSWSSGWPRVLRLAEPPSPGLRRPHRRRACTPAARWRTSTSLRTHSPIRRGCSPSAAPGAARRPGRDARSRARRTASTPGSPRSGGATCYRISDSPHGPGPAAPPATRPRSPAALDVDLDASTRARRP